MKKCTIECNEKQLQLIQRALDFYSRVGIGQFTEIKNHPTFENHLYKVCAPDKTPEVGDRTPQGNILEIKDGKALINGSIDKKKGGWCDKPEWKKLKDVELSTDYSKYHHIRDVADVLMEHYGRVEVVETGMRPGEKLDEMLVSKHEASLSYCYDQNYFVIVPPKDPENLKKLYSTQNAFPYQEFSSRTKEMSRPELTAMLRKGGFL